MRVRHINCGSFCPLLGDNAVSHCLLIETAEHGLVLVDTGIGHYVSLSPRERMSWLNRTMLRPRFLLAESALAQVTALGFARDDVRHIVVTHLDVDHAGGLQDFPGATVHVHASELAAATAGRKDPRYLAALFAHSPRWETYEPSGERFFDFDAVRPLRGLLDEIAIVPLAGHTSGHSGVAVRTNDGWLLHAGDAYLLRAELEGGPVGWGTRLAVRLTSSDARRRQENLRRLADLARDHREVDLICSHSTEELAAHAEQATNTTSAPSTNAHPTPAPIRGCTPGT
jgi:glyoxylase-like metal-dependent hydrolase (beta-lactamase superfamily II)